MQIHRFFVNKISDNAAEITGDDFTHAVSVLRLAEKDRLNVFNYEHGEFAATITGIDKKNRRMTVATGEKVRERENYTSKIYAVIGLTKNDTFEFTLEKLTELGCDSITPVMMKHSVVKIKEQDSKAERWEKIIYSAVKQCGRVSKPALKNAVMSVEGIENAPAGAAAFFAYEKHEGRWLADEAAKIKAGTDAYFIIGPEGGFDASEADSIIKKGYMPVSLGDTTLRADTAAIAAASVLSQYLRRSAWKK